MSAYEPDAEYRCDRDGALMDAGEQGWSCRMCGLPPKLGYTTARHVWQASTEWAHDREYPTGTFEMDYRDAFRLGLLVPRSDHDRALGG